MSRRLIGAGTSFPVTGPMGHGTIAPMTSTFGWLDGDDSQRSAMLEVVKLFEDSSTVDELGIGSVRDTFSNAFFPGTSTLHTRVKYFLFVAWLANDVARHRWPVAGR